jgi:hypothetical protein
VRFGRDDSSGFERVVPPRVHQQVQALAAATDSEAPQQLKGLLLKAKSLVVVPPALRGVRRPVWIAAGVAAALLVTAIAIVPGDGHAATAHPSAIPTPAIDGPIVDDDPVTAAEALLDTRSGCIRDLSILCLDAVVQSDSAASEDDIALVRAIEAGEVVGTIAVTAPDSFSLVERHGDAALVSYQSLPDNKPASLLLVKGEAGWRIRDYLEGS